MSCYGLLEGEGDVVGRGLGVLADLPVGYRAVDLEFPTVGVVDVEEHGRVGVRRVALDVGPAFPSFRCWSSAFDDLVGSGDHWEPVGGLEAVVEEWQR